MFWCQTSLYVLLQAVDEYRDATRVFYDYQLVLACFCRDKKLERMRENRKFAFMRAIENNASQRSRTEICKLRRCQIIQNNVSSNHIVIKASCSMSIEVIVSLD